MDNKINCGIDKLKYNENYKLIKKEHKNVKKIKYYLDINYIPKNNIQQTKYL